MPSGTALLPPPATLDAEDSLHRRVRGLVALSALPALWSKASPSEIVRDAASFLLRALGADATLVRYSPESAESLCLRPGLPDPVLLQSHLRPPPDDSTWPDGQVELLPTTFPLSRIARFHIGEKHSDGFIFAISPSVSFPTELDRSCVSATANLAFASLQSLRRHEELRAARCQLETDRMEMNRTIQGASHDLREPMRQVVLLTDLYRRIHPQIDAQAALLLDNIRFTGEGAVQLVHGLLETYAGVDPRPGPVRVASAYEAIEQALQNLGALLNEAGARVEVGFLPVLPVLHVHLVQLFQNLIGNALKFRLAHPVVQISASVLDASWLFAVQDNGIGIPHADQRSLFTSFRRLRPEFPGAGIGLAICHRIVTGYEGRIWVESAPEQGSIFRFTLPGIPR